MFQEVVRFYKQLATSMGQNVKFSIEHVCEGSDYTVGVNWHLGSTLAIVLHIMHLIPVILPLIYGYCHELKFYLM